MLQPDPVWVYREESCSSGDEESQESEQGEPPSHNDAEAANSFSAEANEQEEEKWPEETLEMASPVKKDDSSEDE